MKKIPLKVLGNPEDKTTDPINYKALIKYIAERPKQDRNGRPEPMPISEVRESLRIVRALDKATKEVILEDADYKLLLKKAQSQAWAKATANVDEFMKDLENPEEQKKEV